LVLILFTADQSILLADDLDLAGFPPAGVAQFFPAPVFAMGAFCLFVGNFVFAYTSSIACVRRGAGHLAKIGIIMPFYWLMISIAAWKGFLQLFTNSPSLGKNQAFRQRVIICHNHLIQQGKQLPAADTAIFLDILRSRPGYR
jgi:Na+/proline symporter